MSMRGGANPPTLAPHASAGEQSPVNWDNLNDELGWINLGLLLRKEQVPSSQRHKFIIVNIPNRPEAQNSRPYR